MYAAMYRKMRLFWPGGLETWKHLRELERTQWLSPKELEALQFAKIRKLVKYAFEKVPYYHELFKRSDIHSEDVKTLRDFQALPFLTKEDVNNHFGRLISPNFRAKLHLDETGGSTGQPMRFAVEDSFWWWNAALEFRGRAWHGVQEGDKIAWLWGAQRDMYDWGWQASLKARILQHRYLNAFSMTQEKMQEFAEMLIRWKPVMIRAYASALSFFAQYMKEHIITGIHPKLIETTAEKLTEPQRQLLEEVFGCRVADCYSARELATIAYQCEAAGLHVCETRFLEVIRNGQVTQPGQIGEVVVTSLHQFAMPLIRYKIGDMAIYESGSCACGRPMPVLREIVGRTHDFLVTADGQVVHGEFFAYTFRVKPEIARYQVYQPDRKHLEVRLVCRTKVDATWLTTVRKELQARFGESMHISVQIVDNIILTPAGKHRFVISDVNPDFI